MWLQGSVQQIARCTQDLAVSAARLPGSNPHHTLSPILSQKVTLNSTQPFMYVDQWTELWAQAGLVAGYRCVSSGKRKDLLMALRCLCLVTPS